MKGVLANVKQRTVINLFFIVIFILKNIYKNGNF